MLRLGRWRAEVSVRTLMMIDSLEMTDADRDVIVRNCQQCDESCIVITHGTDTMVETAAALARGVTGKTIVLTGAMIPYAFGSSDGLFNLGSALSLVQVLPAGTLFSAGGGAPAGFLNREKRPSLRGGKGPKKSRDWSVGATLSAVTVP